MFKICTTLLQKIYFNVVGRFLFFPYFCIISQSILYVFLDIDWNPAIISPTELFATSFTLLAMLSREPKTQIAGVTIVANARMPFHQLRQFYFTCFDILDYLQFKVLWSGTTKMHCCSSEWSPPHLSVHLMVCFSRAFRIFFGLLKPFLNQRIRDIIVFHR